MKEVAHDYCREAHGVGDLIHLHERECIWLEELPSYPPESTRNRVCADVDKLSRQTGYQRFSAQLFSSKRHLSLNLPQIERDNPPFTVYLPTRFVS
jgi:hypothetical protein